MKIYLAGPVVADDEVKNLVSAVYDKLWNAFNAGYVFGNEPDAIYRPGKHKVPNEWGITMQMWGQCVFTMDVLAIDECEWVVLCNFGRARASAGTAWECGYAFAKGKKILVVNMPGSEQDTSIMITGCAANVVDFEQFKTEPDIRKFFVERGRLPAKQILN